MSYSGRLGALVQSARRQALGPRGFNGRAPWPQEPNPLQVQVGKPFPDVCPVYKYPGGTPPPPPERKDPDCGPVDSRARAFICNQAREVAKEVTNYSHNPYIEPTPWSQDFDVIGEVSIAAPLVRAVAVRFRVPFGYVGAWEAFGVEIPPALQTFTQVHPVIDGATLKSFGRFATVYGPATQAPGVNYVPGTLNEPRRIFHALQEEMTVGVDFLVTGGVLFGLLPATLRAVVRGRYWPPTIATRYWTYAKSD